MVSVSVLGASCYSKVFRSHARPKPEQTSALDLEPPHASCQLRPFQQASIHSMSLGALIIRSETATLPSLTLSINTAIILGWEILGITSCTGWPVETRETEGLHPQRTSNLPPTQGLPLLSGHRSSQLSVAFEGTLFYRAKATVFGFLIWRKKPRRPLLVKGQEPRATFGLPQIVLRL